MSSGLLPPASRRLGHVVRRRLAALRPGEREMPTYFIVGAKRAGTTSLDEYLVDHPQVLRGLVEKGCRYYDVNYGRGERWWRGHLPHVRTMDRLEARRGARPVFGESSPYYAFHPLAAERIAADVPDARLIFVLRDPVERAWSHYRYEVARGFEDLPPMEALEREHERLTQPDVDRRWYAHRHFSYVARSRYAEQVHGLLAHFDREQLLLVASEDIFTDPGTVMARVFDHVGLPAHHGADHRPHKALGPSPVPEDFAAFVTRSVADDRAALTPLLPGAWPW